MEEQLISFETAKLAQKKGFNELCLYHFRLNAPVGEQFYTDRCATKNSQWEMSVTAPTQSLLQKWLRETYDINISVRGRKAMGYTAEVDYLSTENLGSTMSCPWYSVYEDCLEKALFEALKRL